MPLNAEKENNSAITIRHLAVGDQLAWRRLYLEYADFYQVEVTDAILNQTWAWLLDTMHPMEGLAAVTATGDVVGLAHFRAFPKPLLGKDAGFLDDLIVDPTRRGQGIGRQLIEGIAAIARERGWPLVRWITAQDNTTARRLYDQVAVSTSWITYDLKLPE